MRRRLKKIALIVLTTMGILSGYGYLEASYYSRRASDMALLYAERTGECPSDLGAWVSESSRNWMQKSRCSFSLSKDGDIVTITAWRHFPFLAFSRSSFDSARAIRGEYSGSSWPVKGQKPGP